MSIDYMEYCLYLYASMQIPVSLYQDGQLLYSSFKSVTSLEFLPVYELIGSAKNPDIYMQNSSILYGKIALESDENTYILLGPAFTIPVTDSIIRSFMRENVISTQYMDQVASFLRNIPLTPYPRFMHHIALIYLTLNNQPLNLRDHFFGEKNDKIMQIAIDSTNQTYENKEEQTLHNTYYFEQELYRLVKEGDVEKLKGFLSSVSFILREGIVAEHPLRQAKNIFIGNITKLEMLAAIPGGMDVEETYSLTDMYIQECEKLHTIEEINSLNYHMLLDFCARIHACMMPPDMPKELHACISFIHNHTNESISIADVAKQIGRSESYLIKKFRDELGINVGTFIMRCKLEEAKSLLTYSDKSLSEISSYLCFSSQSYFQNVFKKKYGITPAQYRKKAAEMPVR